MSKAKKLENQKNLWEQLCALPENVVGEIFNDGLIVSPRPGPKHSFAATNLIGVLYTLFGGGGGSGGWIILSEPELHFEKPSQRSNEENIVVPDLAGWKKEHLPELPETAYFKLPPDCWGVRCCLKTNERRIFVRIKADPEHQSTANSIPGKQ